MAGFEKTAKTSRAGRFPPPRRGPSRRSRLGLLTALDAVRRLSPPRPQRGPRRHRRPSPPSVPRPTPVPPRLGVFNRHPPAWFCGANQETRLPSPLAPSIQDWTPQLSPGLSSSTSTLDARVPAIQRPNARSHRTVDNSLTDIIDYSAFLTFLSTRRNRESRAQAR